MGPEALQVAPNGTAYLSESVAGVVLAGGQNSRMGGVDKAFLTLAGEPVIARTLRLLRACFPETVVVSNRPRRYESFDVRVVADIYPDRGPLAGIHAAMQAVDRPYVFVVACDMPFIQREPLAYLVGKLAGQDAIIPRWEEDIEPLHGLYATRLARSIESALRAGTGAIRRFLPSIDAEYVSEAAMRAVPGAPESFRNINTPEQAARFEVELDRSLPTIASRPDD